MAAIYNPHLVHLTVEKQTETLYALIYLAFYQQSGDYSLHVKLKDDHGLHEDETLGFYLHLERFEDCTLNGHDSRCFAEALGKKETAQSTAFIDTTFERYKKYLDKVLKNAWDFRYYMREIGKPQPCD